MKIRSIVGGRLRKIRKDRGLSLRGVQAKTGIHHSVLGRVENAEQHLNVLHMRRICEALGVSADYLIGLTDNPTPRGSSSSA